MAQSTHTRLNDYETYLANSNVIVNPINELANYANRAASNYYQTTAAYQTAYSQQTNQQQLNAQSSLQQQINQQSNIQHQTNQQQINQQQNDWLQQPVSNSSSSTASTALLQSTTPFQTTITSNGLTNTQLLTPPKLTSKLKANAITIWPIKNCSKRNQQPTSSLLNVHNSQPQLISKLNRSSFTFHLLTCALIIGIVTLLLIVISSIYIYNSCKFKRFKECSLRIKKSIIRNHYKKLISKV